MQHRKVTLALAAIMAAIAVTAIGFAIPQLASAYRHHHSSGVKVNQQISQLNNCKGAPPPDSEEPDESGIVEAEEVEEVVPGPTICENFGDNQADISR